LLEGTPLLRKSNIKLCW